MASPAEAKVCVLERDKLGFTAGAKMVVPGVKDVGEAVRLVGRGEILDAAEVRAGLARSFGADVCCPLVFGIHLRTVCEAAWDELEAGASVGEVVPFWRVVDPGSRLGGKLRCGREWLVGMRAGEVGHSPVMLANGDSSAKFPTANY